MYLFRYRRQGAALRGASPQCLHEEGGFRGIRQDSRGLDIAGKTAVRCLARKRCAVAGLGPSSRARHFEPACLRIVGRELSPNCLQNCGALAGTSEGGRGDRAATQPALLTDETTNWRASSPGYACSAVSGSIPMRYRQIFDLTSVSEPSAGVSKLSPKIVDKNSTQRRIAAWCERFNQQSLPEFLN